MPLRSASMLLLRSVNGSPLSARATQLNVMPVRVRHEHAAADHEVVPPVEVGRPLVEIEVHVLAHLEVASGRAEPVEVLPLA